MMNDTKSLVVVLKLINTCKIVHANVQLFEEAEVRGQESGWDRACEEIVTKPKRDKFDDKFEVGKVTGELIVAHIQDSELLGEDGGEFGRREGSGEVVMAKVHILEGLEEGQGVIGLPRQETRELVVAKVYGDERREGEEDGVDRSGEAIRVEI